MEIGKSRYLIVLDNWLDSKVRWAILLGSACKFIALYLNKRVEYSHQGNLGSLTVIKMGLKRVFLFLTLLTSIYLSHANLENSELKVKNYHYPWIETPYAILILALVTFLNMSIINYINEKSPLSLTISSMLYKDIFHFLVVSTLRSLL